MTQIPGEPVHDGTASEARLLSKGALLVATLLAIATVGWEYVYHAVDLGLDASPPGHVVHILRDTALLWPLALVATLVGLRFGRFTSPPARAAGTSVVMGLLLV